MNISLSAQVHADLSDVVYGKRYDLAEYFANKKEVFAGGERFEIKAMVDTPRTGYQGAIFQHVESGALVVAHRGTEFDREPVRDGLNNLSMVVSRTSVQAPEAIALTRQALRMADEVGADSGFAPQVTVTGHSAGGTLGQITAHHFDLPGHTFNAYGAVSLDGCLPRGGARVYNHVMAGDIVPAASPHYGQVISYARPEHIEAMQDATRVVERGIFGAQAGRPPAELHTDALGSVRRIKFDPHSMSHFASEDAEGQPKGSVLADPQARELAQQNQGLIEGFNQSAGLWRKGVGAGALVFTSSGLRNAASCWIRGEVPPGEPARLEPQSQRSGQGAALAPEASLSPESQRLVQDSRHWVQETAQRHGLGWDAGMDNTALAMAAAARSAGLKQISLFDARQGQIHIGHHDGTHWQSATLDAQRAANTPMNRSFESLDAQDRADAQARGARAVASPGAESEPLLAQAAHAPSAGRGLHM